MMNVLDSLYPEDSTSRSPKEEAVLCPTLKYRAAAQGAQQLSDYLSDDKIRNLILRSFSVARQLTHTNQCQGLCKDISVWFGLGWVREREVG